MKRLFLIIISFYVVNSCISQKQDITSINFNDLKLYEYLLEKHIDYLDKMKEFSTYNFDSVIYVLEIYGVTNDIPKNLKNRKILVLNYDQLSQKHKKEGYVEFTRISPLYIKDEILYITYLQMSFYDGFLQFGEDGSTFELKFDCTKNKFVLVE